MKIYAYTLFFLILSISCVEALVVSPAGGFYPTNLNVSLSAVVNHTIRYTIDSSDPRTGQLVNGLIEIAGRGDTPTARALNPESTLFTFIAPERTGKATVLRAIEYDEKGKIVDEQVKTYFIGWNPNAFTVPVFSVTVNPEDLDSYENGILFKGRTYYDWQNKYGGNPNDPFHPANWNNDSLKPKAYYEVYTSGILQINDTVLFYPSGQWSAALRQKSFKLAYNKDVGKSKTTYAFFGNETIPETVKLRLRTGSQDWDSGVLIRDCVGALIFKETEIETMNCRPAALFLNGEYWGAYNLREDIDNKYLGAKYGVNKDDIVILTKDGDIDEGKAGDNQPYFDLKLWLSNHSLESVDNYAYFAARVNPESLIDFYTCHMFTNNKDFSSDFLFWRNKNPATQVPNTAIDGRWQYFCKDLDQGFGLYNTSDYTENTVEQYFTGDKYAGWPTLFLRKAYENEAFRELFMNRTQKLLDTTLETDRMVSIVEETRKANEPGMARQVERWQKPSNVGSWNTNIGTLKTWITLRREIYAQQVKTFLNITPDDPKTCYDSVANMPVSCTGGVITKDTKGTCRTVVCGNKQVLACDKNTNFEIYNQEGDKKIEICFGNTCISDWGFVKSEPFPICLDENEPICGNGIKEEGEECDGSAPDGYLCTDQCKLLKDEKNISVDVQIAPWYPKGRNYVFLCLVHGFNATSYDWFFSDGEKQLYTPHNNVYHTFTPGHQNVACRARDATHEEGDFLEFDVQ